MAMKIGSAHDHDFYQKTVDHNCIPDAKELAQRWWPDIDHLNADCARMQRSWGVCTNENDVNHRDVMRRCPATCKSARNECKFSEDTCTKIVITGNHYPQMSGTYIRANKNFNGYPVWVHESRGNYIYMYYSGHWVLNGQPYSLTNEWKASDVTETKWDRTPYEAKWEEDEVVRCVEY